MYQYLSKALLLLVLAFASPVLILANSPSNSSTFPPCSPPPAPTNLVITSVTATSISLSWTAPGAPFYEISAVDMSTTTAYPPVTGVGFQATITGLIPGHIHNISLRVAQCADGEFSPIARTSGATALIIVDMIAAFQDGGCTPTNPFDFNGGNEHILCVGQSTSPISPFDHGSVGRIFYGQSGFSFGIAFVPSSNGSLPKLTVLPLVSTPFFGLQQSNSGMVKCFYNNGSQQIEMFNIVPEDVQVTSADVSIIFSSAFIGARGVYYYCNQCGHGRSSTPDDNTQSFLSNGVDESASVAPNPFTESTMIHYNLTTPNPVSIQLYDAIGHLVQTIQSSTPLSPGEYTASVEGSNLPLGSYFVVVQKGNQREVLPLIKQE